MKPVNRSPFSEPVSMPIGILEFMRLPNSSDSLFPRSDSYRDQVQKKMGTFCNNLTPKCSNDAVYANLILRAVVTKIAGRLLPSEVPDHRPCHKSATLATKEGRISVRVRIQMIENQLIIASVIGAKRLGKRIL